MNANGPRRCLLVVRFLVVVLASVAPGTRRSTYALPFRSTSHTIYPIVSHPHHAYRRAIYDTIVPLRTEEELVFTRETNAMHGFYPRFPQLSADNALRRVTFPRMSTSRSTKVKLPDRLVDMLRADLHACCPHRDVRPHECGRKESMHQYQVNSRVCDVPKATQDALESFFAPVLATWADAYDGDLIHTATYGIRVYYGTRRGDAKDVSDGTAIEEERSLAMHYDHIATHHVSATVTVETSPGDEDWPLVVEEDDGRLRNVSIHEGECLLYESARVLHGRPYAFQGTFYANVYVHFGDPAFHERVVQLGADANLDGSFGALELFWSDHREQMYREVKNGANGAIPVRFASSADDAILVHWIEPNTRRRIFVIRIEANGTQSVFTYDRHEFDVTRASDGSLLTSVRIDRNEILLYNVTSHEKAIARAGRFEYRAGLASYLFPPYTLDVSKRRTDNESPDAQIVSLFVTSTCKDARGVMLWWIDPEDANAVRLFPIYVQETKRLQVVRGHRYVVTPHHFFELATDKRRVVEDVIESYTVPHEDESTQYWSIQSCVKGAYH